MVEKQFTVILKAQLVEVIFKATDGSLDTFSSEKMISKS